MASTSEAVKAQFAGFELDLASSELIRDGRRTRLQGQPFLVLRILLDRAGEVVTREELQRELWPGETFVDFDHGLNKAIAKLRDALDDPKSASRLIQTLPRRGYRLTAEVTWIDGRNVSTATEEAAASHGPSPWRRWLTAGVASVLLLSAALWFGRRSVARWFGFRPSTMSLAVLPFENLSNDAGQEYLAAGMTDELITDLSYERSLRVLSRASTEDLGKTHLSVAAIADRLQVDAVIEGSVLRVNNAIRISVRLVAPRPERQLWAASYEGDPDNVIALQNRIATEAVGGIRAQLTPEERIHLGQEGRINPEAHDEYLRARYLLEQETGQEHRAIPHLEHAIQLEPDYAAAYAALGEAWAMEGVWGGKSNREMSAIALEYSQKAVSLDPNSEAFTSLGHSLMQSRRWNDGEVALRKAIQLDPNNPYPVAYLATLLAERGRVDESVRISGELAAAYPVTIEFQRTYASMLYRARRYDAAIAESRRVLELDPNHLSTYVTLANALVEKGRFQEAETAFQQGNLMNPGVEAWLDARKGDTAEARKLLSDNPSLVNVHTAVALYLLGDREEGLAELDDLANQKWAVKTYHLRNDPTFDPMRTDPRFNAIVKKTGLLDN